MAVTSLVTSGKVASSRTKFGGTLLLSWFFNAQIAHEPSSDGSPAPRRNAIGKGPEFFKVKSQRCLPRINRRPAMEPLAPTSGISGAPLPKGDGFLRHRFFQFPTRRREFTRSGGSS
jgi:hypothetical protein